MKNKFTRALGFTLIEMMLVSVIVGTLLYMAMNYLQQRTLQLAINKAAVQMQQIATAATSYYVANQYTWPPYPSLDCLEGNGCSVAYLPTIAGINSPLAIGQPVEAVPANGLPWIPWQTNTFLIAMPVQMRTPAFTYYAATTLAGMLPLSFTMDQSLGSCTIDSSFCWVVETVPVPGQLINNAASMNYGGLYHSGACVPVPNCPVTNMVPNILVTPVSITGANDGPTNENAPTCTDNDTSGCTVDSYPLSSFTATATPKAPITATSGPLGCATGVSAPCYQSVAGGVPTLLVDPVNQYWRVCISVVTEKGKVSPTVGDSVWGQVTGTVMAVTRCSIPSEPSGSDFTVWSQ